jgi:hypothetical protein
MGEEKIDIKRLHRKDVEELYTIVLAHMTKAHDDFMIRGKEDAFEDAASKVVSMIDVIVDGVAEKYEKK